MMGVSDAQIDRSRDIQRRTGRTFYLATRFLPRRVREPTHVLYAFFRISDEIVDGDDRSTDEQIRGLQELRQQIFGDAESDPVVDAFDSLRREHGIPDDEVRRFLDAMEMDVSEDRYESYADLERYMDGSAAAVGRMMTAIMGADGHDEAMEHATALGEAFQMTNFLRDVREDAEELERVYVPVDTLRRHGAEPEDILALEDTNRVRRAVADELERTEELYREGVRGIRMLPEDCRFPVLLAAVFYSDYHRSIRALDHAVVSERPTLSRTRKSYLCLRTWVAWRSSGRDPEEAFYRASCVDRTPGERGVDDPSPGGLAACPVSLVHRLSPLKALGKITTLLRR